jgi:hypothetical protein
LAPGLSAAQMYEEKLKYGYPRAELRAFSTRRPASRRRRTVPGTPPTIPFFAQTIGAVPRDGRPTIAARDPDADSSDPDLRAREHGHENTCERGQSREAQDGPRLAHDNKYGSFADTHSVERRDHQIGMSAPSRASRGPSRERPEVAVCVAVCKRNASVPQRRPGSPLRAHAPLIQRVTDMTRPTVFAADGERCTRGLNERWQPRAARA